MDNDEFEVEYESNADEGPGIKFYVRISRTAAGAKTYTVGATIPWGDFKKGAVRRVFLLEKAISDQLEGSTDHVRTKALEEREDLVISQLADGKWYTTSQLRSATGIPKNAFIEIMSGLVRNKYVKYISGGGRGKPSKYQLIPMKD